jgi:hypothetical protein
MNRSTADGFAAFYREYARTWVHAVATAALTAFGTLTFVHPGFAAVALAAYGLPPLVLYARGRGDDSDVSVASNPDQPTADRSVPGSPDQSSSWTTTASTTTAALHDVAMAGETATAVGTGGVVLERDTSGSWSVSLPDGPGADGAALHGVAGTQSGDVAWVAGDGGAVGRRDGTGRWADHSAPRGSTDNLAALAVAGPAGEETVLLADGSGGVRRGRYRGGEVAWDDPVTPGSGASIAGVTLRDTGTGYVVDTAGAAFRTTDGGRSFTTLDLDADGTPTAVAATDRGPAVATTAGVVHCHDGAGWTPERVTDGELRALATAPGGTGVAVGEGAVHERDGPGDWRRVAVPGAASLRAVALGDGAVAVGTNGTVVERRR